MCRGSLRTRTKLLTAFSVLALVGAVVLSCYALFIKAQAESLLKDLTALTVGSSTESDVEQIMRRHHRYLVSRDSRNDVLTATFTIQNTCLSAVKLEPPAFFRVSVEMKGGRVYHISASLMRSMDIYPTFQASAGIVDEYAEYPPYELYPEHFQFPTPVGKPYLRVLLDSHASPIQRQHAFDFSFRCLTKPGWGCDLSCDYLSTAWQDWRESLKGSDLYPTVFYEHYPKSTRCKMD
jgi:hypothetical protein